MGTKNMSQVNRTWQNEIMGDYKAAGVQTSTSQRSSVWVVNIPNGHDVVELSSTSTAVIDYEDSINIVDFEDSPEKNLPTSEKQNDQRKKGSRKKAKISSPNEILN